jgi:hypothetical protein
MGSDRLHEGLQTDLITSRRASGVWCFWHVLASAIRTTHSLANRTHMQMLIADLPRQLSSHRFFAREQRDLDTCRQAIRRKGNKASIIQGS